MLLRLHSQAHSVLTLPPMLLFGLQASLTITYQTYISSNHRFVGRYARYQVQLHMLILAIALEQLLKITIYASMT